MQTALRSLIMTAAPSVGVVTWGLRPQASALPAVVLRIISEARGRTYAGPDTLITNRVQVDAIAPTNEEAAAVAKAIVAGLDGYKGAVADTEFLGIFAQDRSDDGEEGAAGAALLHRASQDFMVTYKEA